MVKKNKFQCSVCKTTIIHSFYSHKNTICKDCFFIKLDNLTKENTQLKETINDMKKIEDKTNEEMDEVKSILSSLESKSEYLTLSLNQKDNSLSEKDIEIQRLQQIIEIQTKNYEALVLENNENLRKISNFPEFEELSKIKEKFSKINEKSIIFEMEELSKTEENPKITKINNFFENEESVKQGIFSKVFLCRKI